jgi:hypothetical protein
MQQVERQYTAAECEMNETCVKTLKASEAIGNLMIDLMPVVGDAKAFIEAETKFDYTLAVIGTLGMVGDGTAALIKEAKALYEAGEATKAIEKVDTASLVLAKTNRGTSWFENVAKNATRNPESDKLVLGHFADEGASYQQVAAHYDATYFKVEDWNAITKGLSRDEIWQINETFLIQQLKDGKQVLFSHDPLSAKADSFFEREVNFLKRLGYRFEQKNQWTWEAIK